MQDFKFFAEDISNWKTKGGNPSWMSDFVKANTFNNGKENIKMKSDASVSLLSGSVSAGTESFLDAIDSEAFSIPCDCDFVTMRKIGQDLSDYAFAGTINKDQRRES